MLVHEQPADSFVPAWWVPGRHAQTLWGKFARRTPLPSGAIQRWPTPDGDFLEIFHVDAPRGRPRLLLLHGLEGTIHSHYARGMLQQAAARGWGADLLIFRSCGTELNDTPRFYHSGETSDLDWVVRRLVAAHGDSPLVAVGYSLGGNVLLKWLGELGSATPPTLRAAAAVSVPYDLAAGARYIQRGFSHVYERHFLRTLKAKAALKLSRFPGLFDPRALAAAHSIIAFDDAVTAPIHGFADAQDYYARSSSLRFLPEIRTPTLLVGAYDDPFVPADSLQAVRTVAAANPALQLFFAEHGGHVGFVSGRFPGRARYFSEELILSYFEDRLASSPDRNYDQG